MTLRDGQHLSFARQTAREAVRTLRRSAARSQPPVLARTGVRPTRRFWLVNGFSARVSPSQLRRLRRDPSVASVAVDPRVAIVDARAAGVASAPRTPPSGLRAIRALAATRRTGLDGAGVLVGSIDTGVDATHPSVRGKVAAWRDFVGGQPHPYDDNGHGTHTAGTMVGGAPGGTRVGVAPGARVVVAKAIGADGQASGSQVLAAAQWLADPDGDPSTPDQPAVINNSWAAVGGDGTWFGSMLQRWRDLGIVAVFAAGNGGPASGTISPGGDLPGAVTVGAVDAAGRPAGFSGRGPAVLQDVAGRTVVRKPDVVAPGVDVVSAVPGGYAAYTGTSMAAPHVAGLVALLRQADPAMPGARVEAILRRGTRDLGAPGWQPDTGLGAADAVKALTLAGADTTPPGRILRRRSGPSPQAPSVALTLRQIRINQRIAQTALRRADALEDRLAGRGGEPSPPVRPQRAVTLTVRQLRINQRISQAALRRVRALEARVSGTQSPAVRSLAGSSGRRVTLSADQLRINQRIAQEALRRVNVLERRLTGGHR